MFRYTKQLVLAVGAFILLAPAMMQAQTEQEAKIKRAMSAAPPFVSNEATIQEMSGEVLRPGTNGWTCLPDLNGTPACMDAVWMGFLDAMMNRKPFKAERVGMSYMLQPETHAVNNDDPADTTRDPGETWIQEGPHLMFVFPDARTLDGFPTDPNSGGAYVMWKGTPLAHVMVPVGKRP